MPTDENEMPFKVRVSKFRHVYGSPYREQDCYKNISITSNPHDGNFCAVNSKFLAIVTETSGGGSFLVLLLSEAGRIDVDHPRITGHSGPVFDLKFNPFNDNEIASCSEDGTVKIWHIPNNGLKADKYQWKVDLHGHQRRVDYIEWHPTAENLILSAGFDHQIVLWNVEKAEPIQMYRCHSDAIQSIVWNRNGSLFATTCKDKHIRVIEARTGKILASGIGHHGPKTSKLVFLGDTNRLLSTGFGKQFERQVAIWNAYDLSKPLTVETIDFTAGVLVPFYDHDTRMVYLAGKGDGNIRFYELTDQGEPYLYFLSEYKSSLPQRCLGVMPKFGLDVSRHEIMRFYKLSASGSICEPISMIVPRKAEAFQTDIYPETPGPYPALSPDEWISGIDRDPILVSVKDHIDDTNMPQITTYRTFDSTPILSHRANSQRTNQLPIAEVAPTQKSHLTDQSSPSLPRSMNKPAGDMQQQTNHNGLRKIESLKMPSTSAEFNHIRNESIPSPSSLQRKTSSIEKPTKVSSPNPYKKPHSPYKAILSSHSSRSTPDVSSSKPSSSSNAYSSTILSRPQVSKTQEEPVFITSARIPPQRNQRMRSERGKFQNQTEPIQSSNKPNFEVKKKVWSVDPNEPQQQTNGIDYRQEYLKQQEEIQSLQEVVALKDDRIRLLQDELYLLKNQFQDQDNKFAR